MFFYFIYILDGDLIAKDVTMEDTLMNTPPLTAEDQAILNDIITLENNSHEPEHMEATVPNGNTVEIEGTPLGYIAEGCRFVMTNNRILINKPFEKMLKAFTLDINLFSEHNPEVPNGYADVHVGTTAGRIIAITTRNKSYLGVSKLRKLTLDKSLFDPNEKATETFNVTQGEDQDCTCTTLEGSDVRSIHEIAVATHLEVGKIRIMVNLPPPSVQEMRIKPRMEETAAKIKQCPRRNLTGATPLDSVQTLFEILKHHSVVYILPQQLANTPLSFLLNQEDAQMFFNRFFERQMLVRCIMSRTVFNEMEVESYLNQAVINIQQLLSHSRLGLMVLSTKSGDILLNHADIITASIQALQMCGLTSTVDSLK